MSETSAPPEAAQLDELQDSVRGYLPPLLRRLALTYGLPLAAVLVMNAVLPLLLPDFLPLSTATILTFAVHLLIFYFGWQALERRTQATALFVAYSSYSTQRRTLRKALEKGEEAAIPLVDVRKSADSFIRAAQDNGLTPHDET